MNYSKSFYDSLVKNQFRFGVYFQYSLPYSLLIQSGIYDYIAKKKEFPEIGSRERRIKFEIVKKWHDNSPVPLRDSTFGVNGSVGSLDKMNYMVANANFFVFIETYEEELLAIRSNIQTLGAEYAYIIMQTFAEVVFYKYNSVTNGAHTIFPSVSDFGCIEIHLLDMYGKEPPCMLITPNKNKTLSNIKGDFKKALAEDIVPWKTYFSEAKYANTTQNFRTSIIFSSISLECFVSEIFTSQNLVSKSICNPRKFNKISLFDKIDTLINANVISTTIDKNELNIKIKKITLPRNKLVHGELVNFFDLKKDSSESIESLEELYSGFNVI